ncbi:glycosyltransferase family 2 protein [uncultured Psychroserpens sp.]|uniref:glycosyltransferase family 2 protein n=1 Tax=uncultured Psychroserpens sp. TaxID=255436 RepID=UPI002606E4F9|nr:glycosyltransferase family 2 protein [uncultured Psychroserpens sp.]
MTPFFSVIISVYNKEKYIGATINSVLDQTFDDFEIIVVNDGSTDRSLQVLNEFEDSRLNIIIQDNLGASHARNKGIDIAKGKFIALLDGDDIWDKQFLEHIEHAIKTHPNHAVFSCAIAHQYDSKHIPVSYSFSLTEDLLVLDFFEASKKHAILSGSSVVFKTSIIATTGPFNTNYTSGEDTDFWIRVGLHYPIVFSPKTLVYYVYNRDSLSNNIKGVAGKPKYDSYHEEEKKNLHLKTYLDRNRYTLAIFSKLYDDKTSFKFYKNAINPKNLTWKQNLLLMVPKWVINSLLKIKSLNGKKVYYKPL